MGKADFHRCEHFGLFGFGYKDPRAQHTPLPGVCQTHAHRSAIGGLNAVGQKYLGRFPAEFELQPLHRRRGLSGNHAADFARSGKADHVDCRIGGQQLRAFSAAFGQDIQHTDGQSGLGRNFRQRQRA